MKYPLTLTCILLLVASLSFSQSILTDTAAASRNYQIGVTLLTAQRYDSSLVHLQKALPAYETSGDWLKTITCLNRIGESNFGASNYSEAEKAAQRVLKLCSEKLSADHVQTAYARVVLGNVAMYAKSDYSAASVLYHQALETFKKNYGEVHADVAKALVSIAMINSFSVGKFSVMIEYYKKALNILLKVHQGNHPDIAMVYNNLGSAYKQLHDYETAENYLQKALAIYKADGQGKNLAYANCLGNIARMRCARGDYQKAIEYFEQVKRIHQEVYHERHPFVIMVYRGLGDVYRDLRNVELAEGNYRHGIQIAEVMFGKKHPVIAAIDNDLSKLFLSHGDLSKALDYAQQSIIANVFDFNTADPTANPAASAYYQEIREFIYALANKQSIFLDMYKKDKDVRHLSNALATAEISDTVIDEFGKYFYDQTDKLFRGAEAAGIYEIGLEICLASYEATKDKQYLEKAFYFSEKSKARVLVDAISEVKAKYSGNIPLDLLEKERKLKEERSRYHTALQQEKSKGTDERSISSIQDKLFNVSRSYDSLIQHFEKKYPRYHRLKFEDGTIKVSAIQDQLDDRTAVLEYFVGKELACQFLITKSDFQYQTLDSAAIMQRHVSNLREVLNPLAKIHHTTAFKTYVHEANSLFDYSLKEILAKVGSCDNLIIIPDQQLNYVPFDIFLTEGVTATTSYKDLPYLLKKYLISYAYSASTLYNPQKERTNVSGLLAFAPEYKLENDGLLDTSGTFRKNLSPLTWNQQEVERIGARMNGVALMGKDAVERNFKQNAANYNIVHLAMHAIVDDEQPMNSRLVFSASPDSIEDGFLNAHELYNMELSAQMVVLSACETGYGKFERGEGIMSLAHAFTFAGCPSIVMSHWVADDKATADIMELFYINLENGLDKATALRNAKLDFLKNADDLRINPGLWSSFVVIGDRSAVSKGFFLSRVWQLAIAGIVVLVALWMVYFRIKRTRAARSISIRSEVPVHDQIDSHFS